MEIGRLKYEIIPYKNFKQRCRLINEILECKKHFEDLGNCLMIYNRKRGDSHGTSKN